MRDDLEREREEREDESAPRKHDLLRSSRRSKKLRPIVSSAGRGEDPTDNRLKNLRALCQRCHMLHDRRHHLAQRWITYRRRSAVGDLFLDPYPALIAALTSKRTSERSRNFGRHS
jgi:hypothetical protein